MRAAALLGFLIPPRSLAFFFSHFLSLSFSRSPALLRSLVPSLSFSRSFFRVLFTAVLLRRRDKLRRRRADSRRPTLLPEWIPRRARIRAIERAITFTLRDFIPRD